VHPGGWRRAAILNLGVAFTALDQRHAGGRRAMARIIQHFLDNRFLQDKSFKTSDVLPIK
jgi:hypothetical protein